jgi:glycosyltransferase involved in cell wall biosynthesis
VLPVFNAQATLAALVAELLEVLPELTPRFELTIVDDGSTDSTPELAEELSLDYPQLRVIRHGLRRGANAAMHSGLECSTGDYILFCDEGCPANAYDVAKLWWPAATRDVVAGRLAARRMLQWRPRISSASLDAAGDQPAFVMTRRRLAGDWSLKATNASFLGWAARKGCSIESLIVRARTAPAILTMHSPAAHRRAAGASWISRTDHPQREAMMASPGVGRPNFLSRIREFAWGE